MVRLRSKPQQKDLLRSGKEKKETKPASEKLIEEEKAETGNVSLAVCSYYIK